MGISPFGSRIFYWQEGDLEYKLHTTQRLIHNAVKTSSGDEILVLSCRQLGKSYWAMVYAVEFCLRNPGAIVRVAAPTLKQVQDIVSDNLVPITKDAPDGYITRHKSEYRWTIGSSSLRLGAMERSHVDNNRGTRADLVVLEEGGFVDSADYEYALKSVFGPQVLRAQGKIIHVTTPSEDMNHMLHTEIMPKTRLTNSFFQYTIYDNPQLTSEHIAKAMELCGGEHSPAWQREYLAKIIRSEETIVVPPFSERLHVKVFEDPLETFWQVAIDFGGVRDKTAALLYTYDFRRNKYLWKDERVFEPNTSTDEIVAEVRRMEDSHQIQARWADAPGQLQIDLSQVLGFEVAPPLKDDWRAAVNALQVSFAQNQHEIDPRCKFLIQSLQFGRFNKNKTDFDRNPTLGHCDALAAMIYGYRMALKENPYPFMVAPRDTLFVSRKEVSQMEELRDAISPKVFGDSFKGSGHKRFGTFRK